MWEEPYEPCGPVREPWWADDYFEDWPEEMAGPEYFFYKEKYDKEIEGETSKD